MLKKTVLTLSFLLFLCVVVGFNHTLGVAGSRALPAGGIPQRKPAPRCDISPYDELMRRAAASVGLDWRLMCAMAYHESRFDPQSVSHRGARGLMQIMPIVARQFGVADEAIMDPDTNVMLAARLLSKIETTFRFPAGTPQQDRLRIILASYVGGSGHVSDARRLARKSGENPNSWEVVSRYLRLKAEPEYYRDSVVRCGRFTGIRQTEAYVENVLGRYRHYCSTVAL